jgi:hypothetical protein
MAPHAVQRDPFISPYGFSLANMYLHNSDLIGLPITHPFPISYCQSLRALFHIGTLHTIMSASGSTNRPGSANSLCPSVGQQSLMLLDFLKRQETPGSYIPDHRCYACGEGDRAGEPVMTADVRVPGRGSSDKSFDYLLICSLTRLRKDVSPPHLFDYTD